MIQGFKDFITRGNVIDLAVGIIIGAAFTAVVTSLVDNVINPIIAAIFGKPDLSDLWVWTLNNGGTPDDVSDDAVLSIGAFLTAIINFLIIAAAIYFIIVMPLNKLAERRKKGEPAPDEPVSPTEVELLTEIRDALKATPRA
ncbi:large conductance mechanosensitive channel protein MscL [Demequina phytophila]|uniref:large conductance mechanosensitive channel protein MscL n=1 Tax=Demequina phytophila TaxID=1638981 RepID=UPI0007849935|nr:large conductance mechanosensitive channel protein MscL [Demequina phytophila]